LKHAVKIRGKDVRRLTKRAFHECVAQKAQGAIAVLDEGEFSLSIQLNHSFGQTGNLTSLNHLLTYLRYSDEHWTIAIGNIEDPNDFSVAGPSGSGAGSSRDGACSSRDGACSSRDGAGPSGSGAGSSGDGAGPSRRVTWQESEFGTLRERYGGL
jgi:hypothetical protein